MHWFFIALVTPILTSIGNFIDKTLTERFVSREATVWVLSLYSSLFSLLVIPVIFIANPHVFDTSLSHAALLIVAGMIEMGSVFLYLNALKDEDTSTVVPLFQTIPIFSFILGFFILGETLGFDQIVACLGIVVGGVILTLEFSKESGFRLKLAALLFMLGSSFCFALYDALFKFGTFEETFWVSVFWQHIGIALLGLLIFFSRKKYRESFIQNIRENGKKVFGLNAVNELLYAVGVGFYSYALLLAPIALVATVTVYQPVIVFVIGLFFTLFLPRILSEKLSLGHFLQKLAAIVLILICSAYIASYY